MTKSAEARGMLPNVTPAYLYTQYNEDEYLQAIVDAFNAQAQYIYEWMRKANIPIFAGEYHTGDQLKWIAKGIYGVDTPVLVGGKKTEDGEYNALLFDQLPFNGRKNINSGKETEISDDLFKRIMTWNYYKGDGFHFSIPWLKRRIIRFLAGIDGVSPRIDQHWSVSVTLSDDDMNITIAASYRHLTDAAAYNEIVFDERVFNQDDTERFLVERYGYAPLFKSAFDSGLLHVPFYQPINVTVIGK